MRCFGTSAEQTYLYSSEGHTVPVLSGQTIHSTHANTLSDNDGPDATVLAVLPCTHLHADDSRCFDDHIHLLFPYYVSVRPVSAAALQHLFVAIGALGIDCSSITTVRRYELSVQCGKRQPLLEPHSLVPEKETCAAWQSTTPTDARGLIQLILLVFGFI